MHYKLDRTDKEILRHLLEDARKTYTDIAKDLQVSPGTVHVRVKKMEKAGIIRGASLQLDYDVLGYSFIAFVGIYLSKTSSTHDVIEALKVIPEVTVAHIATGRFGIFAKIRCQDTKQLASFCSGARRGSSRTRDNASHTKIVLEANGSDG